MVNSFKSHKLKNFLTEYYSSCLRPVSEVVCTQLISPNYVFVKKRKEKKKHYVFVNCNWPSAPVQPEKKKGGDQNF